MTTVSVRVSGSLAIGCIFWTSFKCHSYSCFNPLPLLSGFPRSSLGETVRAWRRRSISCSGETTLTGQSTWTILQVESATTRICFEPTTVSLPEAICGPRWHRRAHVPGGRPQLPKEDLGCLFHYSAVSAAWKVIWKITFSQTGEVAFQMQHYCSLLGEKELEFQTIQASVDFVSRS